jgi:periplasmic protein TonB
VRRVYTPPSHGGKWPVTVLGALAITLSVFLVLPLTQMVSSYAKRELLVSRLDATVMQSPADLEEPPPPPPDEPPPEEPPPPPVSDAEQPLNLNIDLDLAVGSGGTMAMAGFGEGGAMAEQMAQALDVSDLDKPPSVVSSVPPNYPAALRRAGVEGTVVLVFVLNESGRVEDPRVESSSRPEFEQPAVDAVRRWRFRPGEKGGEAVRTYMRLPIRFRVPG